MSAEQLKGVQVRPKEGGKSHEIKISRRLYQLIGALAVVTLLVACGDITYEPSVVQVAPTNVPTEVAPTEPAEEGAAGDPPDDDDMITITVESEPTEIPQPTATAEADPTRQAIERFVNFFTLSAEAQAALDDWGHNADLGGLGISESFQALSGFQLRVVGNFGADSTYQYGDIIQRMDAYPGYFPFTAKALDNEGNEVEITEEFTLTDDNGSIDFIYTPGVTTVYWNSPAGEQYRFDPITEEFYAQDKYDEIVEVREAQAAGFLNVVTSEYDETTGRTYGLDGNGTRIAEEDENGVWIEYVEAAPEWLFGSEEKVTYEFADMMEIPAGTMAIIQTNTGGWDYVPYNSQAVLNLLNLQSADQILAPGELYALTEGQVNSESFPAKMEDGIGTNSQLFRAAPFVLRGSYRFTLPNKPDLTSVGFNGYSWTTDELGNPLLIAEPLSVKIEGLSDNTPRDYGSTLKPDGTIDFVRSSSFQPQLWNDETGTPFTSFEDFINYVSQNPDNPIVGYILGTVPDPNMTGPGKPPILYDRGAFDPDANYDNTFDYPQVSNAFSFAGFYLPEDFGNSEN